MANVTIEGCVIYIDGSIMFKQDGPGEDDCTYYGCIIWTGVHAGQVAITVETELCDDIYYGCVDWDDGGKFKVDIPGDCCNEGSDPWPPPDEHCGCENCDSNTTPYGIKVVVGGVSAGGGCAACGYTLFRKTTAYPNLNKSYFLPRTGPCSWGMFFTPDPTWTWDNYKCELKIPPPGCAPGSRCYEYLGAGGGAIFDSGAIAVAKTSPNIAAMHLYLYTYTGGSQAICVEIANIPLDENFCIQGDAENDRPVPNPCWIPVAGFSFQGGGHVFITEGPYKETC